MNTKLQTRIEDKTLTFEAWESQARDFTETSAADMHTNELLKAIKKGNSLIEVYREYRNWWKNDVDDDKLHHGHTLKKKVQSHLSEIELMHRRSKK